MDTNHPSFFPYLPEVLGGKNASYEEMFSFDSEEASLLRKEKYCLESTVLKLMQELQDKTKQLDRVTHYLDSIVKNISEGLIFVSHTGIITTYNAAAEKILGLKQKDVLYTNYAEKFSDNAFGFSMSAALKKLNCPGINLVKYLCKDRIEKEIEVSTSPVIRKSRSQQGIILVLRDITKQRLQMKFEQQNIRMQEIGQMAATVAHEIRNPLGGIEGFASLIQKDLASVYPDSSKMAGYIIEGSKTIGRLIENLLRSARPLSPKLEEVDIVELIHEIQEHIKIDPTFPDRIHIQVENYQAKILLLADRSMIRSVLLHMIRNSCQAIHSSGLVQITLYTKDQNVIVTLKDTGSGIAPENLEKLFLPFFTTKEKGTGLGLYESLRIIQSHNGHIDVKSSCDSGTLFIITLPIKGFLP
ncbi:MAG: PAS domain-containing protein [Chlamydiae bacterium]|nr:PAS domain-containing protein [Chlamydiota bacterium]